MAYGSEFKSSAAQCTGSGTISCTVTLAFKPLQPGLREDAVLVTSGSSLLATTLVYGTGLAAQMSLYPANIKSIAGNGMWGWTGDGGRSTAATLRNPQGVSIDNAGNLYIADSVNQVVREVNAQTGLISTIAGNGLGGYWGDGGPANKAGLNNPTAVALDGAGNIYIADQGNNLIRKITAKTQQISTVAGGGGASGPDGLGDGGPATNALLAGPNDVALDGAGNIFIADSYHGLIRRVDAFTGVITVAAGGGTSSGNDGLGDGGPATKASLRDPVAVALDVSGNLYIADSGNFLVRRVDINAGTITVVAGNGRSASSGDSGLAVNASFVSPYGVRIDAAGNVYIADTGANTIRRVSSATGIITTLAGTGAVRYTGDGSLAINAALAHPTSVALDAMGNLFVADTQNNAIRQIAANASSLAFPATTVGEVSTTQVMNVLNIGNQQLNFTALTFGQNFRQQSFGAADCAAGSILSAGSGCLVAIQFVPATAGSLTASLTMTTNALGIAGSSRSVSLSATGRPSTASPQVSLSPAALTFGNQTIGTVSTTQSVTLSNTGSGPLSISSIRVEGTNASDFNLSSGCQNVLASGARCTLSVSFSPLAGGARIASIVLIDQLATAPLTLAMNGSAGTAKINFSPANLNFGGQPLLSNSVQQSLAISNTGSAPADLSSMAISGTNSPDFAMINTCPSTLPIDSTCSLSITFSPSGTGTRTANLSLRASAGSAQTLPLSGTGSAGVHPVAWRPSTGNWNGMHDSSGNPILWGTTGDIAVPGDYDGDGKTDIAVFRPATSMWYILLSHNSSSITQAWGTVGDIPVVGDYDGDGKADIAVFRPSTSMWYVITSHNWSGFSQAWGTVGDIPVVGDYDGDGKADIAVFRPSASMFYIIGSQGWHGFSQAFGTAGDIPVVADYDGDGKTDIAVFRPSTSMWYITMSRTGTVFTRAWGGIGDIPVVADYDGDGKADIAIFRPSTSVWYLIESKTGSGASFQFGASGDVPISAFSKQ